MDPSYMTVEHFCRTVLGWVPSPEDLAELKAELQAYCLAQGWGWLCQGQPVRPLGRDAPE